MMKNRKIYEPPRYMRTHQAADQLLSILSSTEGDHLLTEDTPAVGLARLGTEQQSVVCKTLKGRSEVG